MPEPGDTAPVALDFGAVYRAHAGALRRFALYLSGDAALADDVVSEAFMRLWTARDRIVLPTLRGYLFTIVRNLFLQRRRRDRHEAPLDEALADNQAGPEERATSRSELQRVIAALGRLPEIDRAAVLMRADEGLPYEEIAAALGLTTAAAKVKVHRARLKLAEARVTVSSRSHAEER